MMKSTQERCLTWLLVSAAILTTLTSFGMAQPPDLDQSTDHDVTGELTTGPGQIDFNTDEYADFGNDDFEVESPLDPATENRLQWVTLIVSMIAPIVGIASALLAVYIAFQLSSALSAVPEPFREMPPYVPWLTLIPLVGIVVLIFALIKVPRSLRNYLASVNEHSQGDCGEKLGIWSFVLCLLGCTAPIGLVLLIMSILKIGKAKRLVLDLTNR